MATFLSKPGFKPVKHLTGTPYNGQTNTYAVSGAVTLVPGDVVTLAADGTSTSGIPNCTIATATSAILGVVVGVYNTKLDPVEGKMTSGSISLDTPQTATTGGYVLVADAPDLIFETEIATYATTGINSNLETVPTTLDTTTGNSNMKVITNGGEATDPWKLLGLVQRNDFIAGTGYQFPVNGDTNVKVLVTPNNHVFKGGTGTASV